MVDRQKHHGAGDWKRKAPHLVVAGTQDRERVTGGRAQGHVSSVTPP